MIYEFSSNTVSVKTIENLHAALTFASGQMACVLKGVLQKPLVLESRAGSTDPETPTEWVCLDVDGVVGIKKIDALLKLFGLDQVDYIVQWSSSMGIENKTGLRCHVFMLLATPQHPVTLKLWLRHLNLSTPLLASQLALTKTGNALRWPLDITTCQNDKLIYIAPPILHGIPDPYPNNRIQLVKKKHRAITTLGNVPFPSAIDKLQEKKLDELRTAAGMPKRKLATKFAGTTEYLAKPDEATITGRKHERGFVYFNLNGGDSWGYYHPENNPEFIFNFKGEPTYRTRDLLPSYWAEVMRQDRGPTRGKKGELYLAFREADTGDYFNAIVENDAGKIELLPAKNEKQLNDFLSIYGQPPIGDRPVPILRTYFDPHSSLIYDEDAQTINTYNPPTITSAPGTWPTIEKIIAHVLGNDAATIDHFYNWLACALQRLDACGTAWIWHGTFGTGKGILYHRVLAPMFGLSNVVAKRMEELESEFSGYMKNKFVVFIDEMEQGRSLYHAKIEAKLKNLITEPTISIRGMYREAYMAHNYSNMIFASNKPAPVMVRPNDRRFNVGVYQPKPLLEVLPSTEIDLVDAEVPAFMDFLLNYTIDRDRARTPLINAAREQLIDTNQVAIDEVSEALLKGNLEFFWMQLLSEPPSNPLVTQRYEKYKLLLTELVTNQPATLTREELRILYDWAVGDMPESPNKFTALLKHHRIHMSSVWKNQHSTRGVKVTWHTDASFLRHARKAIKKGLP